MTNDYNKTHNTLGSFSYLGKEPSVLCISNVSLKRKSLSIMDIISIYFNEFLDGMTIYIKEDSKKILFLLYPFLSTY